MQLICHHTLFGPVYRRHLSSLPYQVLYSTLSTLRTAVSTPQSHPSSDPPHFVPAHSPQMPTSHAQTPYITPYIIHQHSGYEDPSVNNCTYSCFSSTPRPAFPPPACVAHPIPARYGRRFARYTLTRITTILILPKPQCWLLAYSGTTLTISSYKPTIPRLHSACIPIHSPNLPIDFTVVWSVSTENFRPFASDPSAQPHVSQRQNAFPFARGVEIRNWTHLSSP